MLFARKREAPERAEAAPPEHRKAPKLKGAALEPVTPEAFDALRRKFEALQTVLALVVLAVEKGIGCAPGHPDASPVARLGKIAKAAEFDLDATVAEALRTFIGDVETASAAERRREQRETAARTAPRTFETCRPPSWRG